MTNSIYAIKSSLFADEKRLQSMSHTEVACEGMLELLRHCYSFLTTMSTEGTAINRMGALL